MKVEVKGEFIPIINGTQYQLPNKRVGKNGPENTGEWQTIQFFIGS